MKKKFHIISIFTFLIAGSVLGQPPSEGGTFLALNLSREAESMKSEFDDTLWLGQMEDFLLTGMSGCDEYSDSQECREVLYYSIGYFFHQEAIDEGFQNRNTLERAENYYLNFLDSRPDDVIGLKNLQVIRKYLGRGERLEETTQQLIQADPQNKQSHLKYYGDILKERGQGKNACEQYYDAFRENPWNEAICRRLAAAYQDEESMCSSESQMVDFIYTCDEYELTALSIDVAESMLYRAYRAGDLRLLEEMLVHWVNLLAGQNWLDVGRIMKFRLLLEADSEAYRDLVTIFRSNHTGDWPKSGFWYQPERLHNSRSGEVSPLVALAKIHVVRSRQLRQRGDINSSVKVLEEARTILELLQEDNNYDPVFFTVSTELAKMYFKYPKYDPNGSKMSELEQMLFRGKYDAYMDGNKELIKTYHTTLGLIYYDQQKTESKQRARNAEFQLRNALKPELGEIINPRLREMLAEVYEDLERYEDAAERYHESAMDYLRLDDIKNARSLINHALTTLVHTTSGDLSRRLVELDILAKDRLSWQNPSHPIHESTGTQFLEGVRVLSEKESTYKRVLTREFVDNQFFKGYADMAKNSPANRTNYQQFLFSKSLNNLSRTSQIANVADREKIQAINTSIDNSLTDRRSTTEVSITSKYTPQGEYRAYSGGAKVISFSRQETTIRLPAAVMELGDRISTFYMDNGFDLQRPQYKMIAKANDQIAVRFEQIKG